MIRNGKVLRDGLTGTGLVSVDGIQYPFTLETHWRSDEPPRSGMAVSLEMDEQGQLQSIYAGKVKTPVCIGKVLRDGQVGTGLISFQGVQHPFTLEAHWRSDMPPKVGLSVQLDIDAAGQLKAVYALDRQAEMGRHLGEMGGRVKEWGEKMHAEGLPILQDHSARLKNNPRSFFGMILAMQSLIFGLIIFSFYQLLYFKISGLSIGFNIGFLKFSLMELLGVINQGGFAEILEELVDARKKPNPGLWGLIPWACAALIFLPFWLKKYWSVVLALAPAVLSLYFYVEALVKMRSDEWDGVSFGMGLYVPVVLSLAAAALACYWIASGADRSTRTVSMQHARPAPAPAPAPAPTPAPAPAPAPVLNLAVIQAAFEQLGHPDAEEAYFHALPASLQSPALQSWFHERQAARHRAALLAMACKGCSTPLQPDDVFCGECGTRAG